MNRHAGNLLLGIVRSGLVQVGPVINRVMAEQPGMPRYEAYNVLHSLTSEGYLEQYSTVRTGSRRKIEALQLTEKGLGLFQPYR